MTSGIHQENAPGQETPLDQATAPDPATRLCLACGLCCNGVMFHWVWLQPEDSPERLAAVGLRLRRKQGRHAVRQPCAAHREGACTIYEERPSRCRRFRCRQLTGVLEGRWTDQEALTRIAEAKSRVARVETLARRADGRVRQGPLSRRVEATLGEPFDPKAEPHLIEARETLVREWAALDALLDAEFRVEPDAGSPG